MNNKAKTIRARQSTKAFTVVELLIVIVVIVVLSAITFVGYNAVKKSAYDASVKSDLQKLSDVIALQALDIEGIPDGGATHLNTGDSTVLPGIIFKPTPDSYDASVANLYYCAGTLNGSKEYAIAAKSKSGTTFALTSNEDIQTFTGYTFTAVSGGVPVCTALGFTAPFTWSYGYNKDPAYGWFAWAFNGETLTNYATNPSAETTAGWHSNNGAVYPAIKDTSMKRTGTQSVSASNVDASTSLMSLYAPGAPDGNGIPITEEGTYSASVYFRSGVAHTGRLGSNYRLASTGAWSGIEYGPTVTGSTTAWTRMTATIDVPAGIDRIRHGLYVNATSSQPAGTKAYVDDFMLTKTSDYPAYADGQSYGWDWNGTVNGSTSTGPRK